MRISRRGGMEHVKISGGGDGERWRHQSETGDGVSRMAQVVAVRISISLRIFCLAAVAVVYLFSDHKGISRGVALLRIADAAVSCLRGFFASRAFSVGKRQYRRCSARLRTHFSFFHRIFTRTARVILSPLRTALHSATVMPRYMITRRSLRRAVVYQWTDGLASKRKQRTSASAWTVDGAQHGGTVALAGVAAGIWRRGISAYQHAFAKQNRAQWAISVAASIIKWREKW